MFKSRIGFESTSRGAHGGESEKTESSIISSQSVSAQKRGSKSVCNISDQTLAMSGVRKVGEVMGWQTAM